MKNPYIPSGCDQQGRIPAPCRSDFLTQPAEWLHASRDGLTRAERSTPIEGPYHADDGANHWAWWLAAALLLCLIPAAPIIAEWIK